MDLMDLNEEIRKLAYGLYEKSGKIACRDLDNWLEAEKMILARQNPETVLSSPLKQKRATISKKTSKK